MKIKSTKILVGITGGIAAYKACSLVASLIKDGADVRVIMTENATKFVTPLTFQSITNFPVYCDLWQTNDSRSVEHIDVAHWPDIVVIMPATANTIAKIANGIADNYLTTVLLALLPKTPVIVAPAMNTNMWLNLITQSNISKIKSLKTYTVLDPRTGVLACRDEGPGKVPDNKAIIDAINKL